MRTFSRRFLTLVFALSLSFYTAAQGISVAGFYLATNDLTANTYGTEQFDQNGERCALIKIETTQKGFAFNVGTLGVTKVEDNHVGEVWVYVPRSVRRITIQHQQLGTLRDYYFPINIESGRTYIMKLTTGNVSTVVEQDVGGSYLIMKVQPANATIFIDDVIQNAVDGTLSIMLPYGRHTYSVQSASYVPEAGEVTIGTSKVTMDVILKSAKATLNVITSSEASIYVNDAFVAKGSWTGALTAGMYLVEARNEGCRTVKETVTLKEQEQRTLKLAKPQPMYGKLQVETTPPECEVWLDGKRLGSSPDVFANIIVGEHNLRLVRLGGSVVEQKVTIAEGQVESVKVTMPKGHIMNVSSSLNADLYLDGKNIGKMPMEVEVPFGQHIFSVNKGLYRGEQYIYVSSYTDRNLNIVPEKISVGEYMQNGIVYAMVNCGTSGSNSTLGLTLGTQNKGFGWFATANVGGMAAFNTVGVATVAGFSDGSMPYYTGKVKHPRMSFDLGFSCNLGTLLGKPFPAFAYRLGLGYGLRRTCWETAYGTWLDVPAYKISGLEWLIGCQLNIRRVNVSLDVVQIGMSKLGEFRLGIGTNFRKR